MGEVFLGCFPAQNVQVKSMSLMMVEVKRNNIQLEINFCYLVQHTHHSVLIWPLLKNIRVIIIEIIHSMEIAFQA